LMYDLHPGGIPKEETGISGSRSCTKITKLVCLRFRDI